MSVAFDFAIQITVFVAILALDERRRQREEAECCCCYPSTATRDDKPSEQADDVEKMDDTHDANTAKSGLRHFLGNVYVPTLSGSRPLQALVLCVAAGLLAMNVYFMSNLEEVNHRAASCLAPLTQATRRDSTSSTSSPTSRTWRGTRCCCCCFCYCFCYC